MWIPRSQTMKNEIIELLKKDKQLRPRQLDIYRIKSMIEIAETNMKIVKKIPVNEESATLIFRETYESIRQLGDAQWWLLGYEPKNHEVSMDILKDMEIKEKIQLNNLSLFKKIRHDVNYRGFKVDVEKARNILEFWGKCSDEIIKIIKEKIK